MPLQCVIETLVSYDWEKDILTVLLRDVNGSSAVGILQNQIGAIIYWARLWKEFPLPINIINATCFQGTQLIVDIHEVILNPAFLVRISDINSWTYCDARIYATEFLGITSAPSDHLLRGSIIHNFLARIFQRENLAKLLRSEWHPTLEIALQRATLENWTLATILGWEEGALIKEVGSKIMPAQATYLKEYINTVSPDMQIETEVMVFSFRFGLKGRIDRLELFPTGDCTLIETKTGRPTFRSIRAAENQALAYYLALKDVRNVEPQTVRVEFPLEPLEKRNVEKPIDATGLLEVINIRNRIYGILHGQRPFILDRENCASCFNVEVCQFLCFVWKTPAALLQCDLCKRFCIVKDAILKIPSLANRLYLIQQYYLFFLSWIRLSERNSQEQRQVLNLPVSDRVARGNCLAGLTYGGAKLEQGGVTLLLAPSSIIQTSGSTLRQGDYVFVSHEAGINLEGHSVRGIVRLVMEDKVHVFFPGFQEMPLEFQSKDEKYALDLVPQNIVEAREKVGLDWLIRGSFYPHLKELEILRDVVLFARKPVFRKTLPTNIDLEIQKSKFDESQKSAIIKALQSRDLYCIQGPPGTGKTTVICEIVSLLVTEFRERELNQGYLSFHRGFPSSEGSLEAQNINLRHRFTHHRTPVLVSAFTNRAVDNIVAKLVKEYPALKVIRLGNPDSIQDPVAKSRGLETLVLTDFKFADGNVERLPSAQVAQFILNSVDVVAVTSTSAGNQLCQQMCFHAAIIDEAGQITEPSTLISATLAEKVILVGDQMQLPPVVDVSDSVELNLRGIKVLKEIGLHPRTGYARSLFERLMEKWHDSEHSSLLQSQYRMNGGIARIASELFYDGKIQTGGGPEVANQNVQDFFRHNSFDMQKFQGLKREMYLPERPVVFVDTCQIGVEDSRLQGVSGPQSRYNPVEAQIVAELCVYALIQETQGNIEKLTRVLAGIGIITTYRAQVREISNQIEQSFKKYLSLPREEVLALLDHLEIDTVDRFQGREKEIVIFSFVDSNHQCKISSLTAETRRFNVALTRAKKKAIIIGNSETLTISRSGERSKIAAAKRIFQKLVTILMQQNAIVKITKDWQQIMH